MTVSVNGEQRTVAKGSTVGSLLRQLGVEGDRVAVELERQIVRRADWEATTIEPGSVIEVVQFVGGG